MMQGSISVNPSFKYNRLSKAQAQGLRISILCRTLAIVGCAIWFFFSYQTLGRLPRGLGIAGIVMFAAIGLAYLPLIGSNWDRPWVKYAISTLDVTALCTLFVLIPVSTADDIPQIIAFRAYGIYYLLPFLGLACLSLSWGLVAYTGLLIVIGWWSAFWYVVSNMENTLSWGDLPPNATRQDYQDIYLSFDFISVGGRVEETGFVMITALILALTVYRARQVFFAQIAAESLKAEEQRQRERVSELLGQYVPETIANRLLSDDAALAPQVKLGTVLVADIEGFSSYSAGKSPEMVIRDLNNFLAECADDVSDCDGVVISFLGDGFLATFNTPIEVTNPAEKALQAARLLVAKRGSDDHEQNRFPLRIGIATGEVATGTIGSATRQAFTVYGETVNRAARLEQFNKKLNTRIVLDEESYQRLDDKDGLVGAGKHQLKGMNGKTRVYSIASVPGESRSARPARTSG